MEPKISELIPEMSENCKDYDNNIPIVSTKALYLDVETADVYFVVGPDEKSTERIPAHKNLIAAASDVFKRMFYGPLKETGDIILYGVNNTAFIEFLQFFYNEKIKLSLEYMSEVMNLAHKYNVTKCLELCVAFLKDTLTDDNICIGLNLALMYEQDELIKFCEKRLIVNTNAIFKSSGFLDCHRQILAHILTINKFSCTEMDVFEACMSWVKAASKQENLTNDLVQAHLGELFYHIRFASMKMKDFASLTGQYGFLFSFDEYKEIVQLIELPAYNTQFFNANPRELTWNNQTIVTCDRTIPNKPKVFPRPLKRIEATAFSTNEPILLGSVICCSLGYQHERRSQTTRSKQLVEVTIVEISGTDIPESDTEDDDDDDADYNGLVQETVINDLIQPNHDLSRNNQTDALHPHRRDDRSEENRAQHQVESNNIRQSVGSTPAFNGALNPAFVVGDTDGDDDDDDDEDEQPNEENNDDNDDDYDLIFEKTISNHKVYLRFKTRTKIILSKPVLIRPGFLYEIRIQQTPYKQCYNARWLKTNVKLESDITIRFHPDSLHNTKKYGLVCALEFNKI